MVEKCWRCGSSEVDYDESDFGEACRRYSFRCRKCGLIASASDTQ